MSDTNKKRGRERRREAASQAAHDAALAAENRTADEKLKTRGDALRKTASSAIVKKVTGEPLTQAEASLSKQPAGRLTILAELAKDGIDREMVADAMNVLHEITMDAEEVTAIRVKAANAILGKLGSWFGLEAVAHERKDRPAVVVLAPYSEVIVKSPNGDTATIHTAREATPDASSETGSEIPGDDRGDSVR